jgi:hypothetical protein
MLLETNKPILFFIFLFLSSQVFSNTYSSPAVGDKYFVSSSQGEFLNEVVSVDSDRYLTTSTNLGTKSVSEITRFLGFINFTKNLREDILSLDRDKAKALFPLKVGNKVTFSSYGGNPKWYRDHTVEVTSAYTSQIGEANSPIFTLKMRSETPGYFKFEGTCEYSVKLAFCIQILGDLFIKGNPDINRPVKLNVTKALLGGVDLVVKIPDTK